MPQQRPHLTAGLTWATLQLVSPDIWHAEQHICSYRSRAGPIPALSALRRVVTAAAAFAASYYGKLHVDKSLLLKAFAVLSLGTAVVNLLKRGSATYDHVRPCYEACIASFLGISAETAIAAHLHSLTDSLSD